MAADGGAGGARKPLPCRLSRQWFGRPVLEVAPQLLGCVLRYGDVAVRLTEVEAYDGENDPGSHAYRGATPRTEVMFGPPGYLYVYFTYGMHHCVNVVTGSAGAASAVLLRAGEVVDGHDTVAVRRAGVRPRDWARGPARLALTLGLARAENGLDVCPDATSEQAGGPGPGADAAWFEPPVIPAEEELVRRGPRVGVSGAGGDGERYPWRFWLSGEPTVSVYRAGVPRRARGRR